MPSAARRPRPRLDGIRLLIVEDHPDSAELLRRLLESEGASAAVAHSAPIALDWLARAPEPPHLVLYDLRMPGVDGFAFKAMLDREPRYARIPVVAVTALTTSADHQHTLEAGFAAHVDKPMDFDGFVVTIQRVLGTRSRTPRRRRRRP